MFIQKMNGCELYFYKKILEIKELSLIKGAFINIP